VSWLPYTGAGVLLVAVFIAARRRRSSRRRLTITFDWHDEREDRPDHDDAR
jgi:hypothetical protein